MNIDISTTSTIRPSILDRTLNSFCSKIFNREDIDFRLIINIDFIGETAKYSREDVLDVAKKYFKNIKYNYSDTPSFTKSVKWCWSNVDAGYVFHLEDDWVLNENIDIKKLINVINDYENLAMIRLYKGKMAHNMKPFDSSYIKNEHKNMIRLLPKRACLNPGLFVKKYIQEASQIMVDNLNPESQLCYGCSGIKHIDDFINKWEYSVYGYDRRVVTDIGREWRRRNRINRKPDFMKWEI